RIVGWKTRLVFQADEELAAVRVGASVRHRDSTGLVRALDRLIVEFIARAARPRAGRITALDDEAWHHAMEGHPVIVAIARQGDEVVDGQGRLRRVHLKVMMVLGGLDDEL